jgi:hypothetical protein
VSYIKRANIRWNLRSVCFVLVTLSFEVIMIFLFMFIFLWREIKCENGSVSFFFVYLLSFSFSLLGIEFGVIPSSKVVQCLTEWIDNSGGYYFYLKIFFDFICIIYANFKVLDIILERVFHVLIVKGENPRNSEKVLYI